MKFDYIEYHIQYNLPDETPGQSYEILIISKVQATVSAFIFSRN
jgi:hypothetical protein